MDTHAFTLSLTGCVRIRCSAESKYKEFQFSSPKKRSDSRQPRRCTVFLSYDSDPACDFLARILEDWDFGSPGSFLHQHILQPSVFWESWESWELTGSHARPPAQCVLGVLVVFYTTSDTEDLQNIHGAGTGGARNGVAEPLTTQPVGQDTQPVGQDMLWRRWDNHAACWDPYTYTTQHLQSWVEYAETHPETHGHIMDDQVCVRLQHKLLR
eukprot:COSAG02_NODE_8600_length_2508_cov_77.435450_2_plen_212_part_00